MLTLPLDERGYPIPYFVPIINGKPDFRFQDAHKKETCRKYLKCNICGKKLKDREFWFITGPLGLMNSVASDEPSHEDCARFSLRACPHLVYRKAERRTGEFEGHPSQLSHKPERIFLVRADKIYHVDPVITRFRAVDIYPFKYENNKLIEA